MSSIPLVDLKAQYRSIKEDVDGAMTGVVERADFIGGGDVKAFCEEFAKFCEAKACVGVGNGTDALYVALRSLGVGPGDEVITVSHTFIATTEAITLTGARVVFVDIDRKTMLLDPAKLESAISARTKAIVAVHLYGQPCDMDAILSIARERGLAVVEDAAQAHGAMWKGQRVGALGDLGCFSFYPGKNLGAYGDGGAVVGNDMALVEKVKMTANHGRLNKYEHEFEGVNSRLDTIQAAVLRVKLRHLDTWNAARQAIAERYMTNLNGLDGVETPFVDSRSSSVWHLFVIRVEGRERLQEKLKEAGVATGFHYPVPLHKQPAYRHVADSIKPLPVTETAASRVISLPIYAELEPTQVDFICDRLRSAL